jgi:hypothetical protein
MHPVLFAISLMSVSQSISPPVAALRVHEAQSTFTVNVTVDSSAGYQITIDCVEGCKTPIHYRETASDSPLGLFSRDQYGLIFSIWSGGSAYRVLVWSVADDSVRKVAELSSRGRPDFTTGPNGTPRILAHEADSDGISLHSVCWSFVNTGFVRSGTNGC